jgi:hypothetical protein
LSGSVSCVVSPSVTVRSTAILIGQVMKSE